MKTIVNWALIRSRIKKARDTTSRRNEVTVKSEDDMIMMMIFIPRYSTNMYAWIGNPKLFSLGYFELSLQNVCINIVT